MKNPDSDIDLLRSIFRADTELIIKEIEAAQPELALTLPYEGGGRELYRYRTDIGFVFRSSGASMDLDENDDEIWRDWEGPPARSLWECLDGLRMGTSLLCLRPRFIHQDHIEEARRYFNQQVGALTEEERARFGEYFTENFEKWIEGAKTTS